LSELLRGARLVSHRRDVVDFTSSLKADQELLESVVTINKAHVIMMAECRIVNQKKASKLLEALGKINEKIDLSKTDCEDVHMYVEEMVTGLAGSEIGGDLHIAKSRNDQVATAIRMRLRQYLLELLSTFTSFQETLLDVAGNHVNTIVPGYTHTQPAQPITFAHHLLSYSGAFGRDIERLMDAYSRVNMSPMGAGALATTSFPISRERVAELLGFSGVIENSIDAVGSRDFLLEVQSCLTLAALNVSRLAEDLILWSSVAFGIIELPDEFASTSSIMPQKKNPEVLEIIRARIGDVIGNFVATATTMKSLPSGYNLDLQELTPKLWETIECISSSLFMLTALLPLLKVTSIKSDLLDFSTSTELANMLVKKHKIPFRSAHRIVGTLVQKLVEQKRSLSDATPELLESVSKLVVEHPVKVTEEEIQSSVSPLQVVKAHNVRGGPSPEEVARALATRRQIVASWKKKLSEESDRLQKSRVMLQSLEEQYLSSNHG